MILRSTLIQRSSDQNGSSIQTARLIHLCVTRLLPLLVSVGCVDLDRISYTCTNRGASDHHQRICPGRWLSAESLRGIVASVLAVYNITPPIDKNGKPSEVSVDVTSGLIA
jgi:hypothetical protein